MRIIGTSYEPCPIGRNTPRPQFRRWQVQDIRACLVEVHSEWWQEPDTYVYRGETNIAGYLDMRRELWRYCLTHKFLHHEPARKE